MKQEKIKCTIAGVIKIKASNGKTLSTKYDLLGLFRADDISAPNHPINFFVEINTDNPKFCIGDIVELSIKQSSMTMEEWKVTKC